MSNKGVLITLWNICDTLAGKVDEQCAADAFIIAANELSLHGDNEWKYSPDYRKAMMVDNVIISIPFCGFYESWYDSELDSIIERECEYRCDDRNGEGFVDIPESEYKDILYRFADFGEAHKAIARKYVDRFNDFLAEEFDVDQGLNLEFEKLESPKEYNFSTDRIFAFIPKGKVDELFNMVNQGDLAQTLRDHFTPASGFIPFYSNDVLAWLEKPVAEWDYNELSMLLHALLIQCEDWQFTIYERMTEDCQTAFDNCVDWQKVGEAVQEWKEENEVIA